MKQQQRGASLVGLLFFGLVITFAGILTIQIVPTLIEFQSVTRAATLAAAGGTVGEVKSLFDKRAQIDNIKAIANLGIDLGTAKSAMQTMERILKEKDEIIQVLKSDLEKTIQKYIQTGGRVFDKDARLFDSARFHERACDGVI